MSHDRSTPVDAPDMARALISRFNRIVRKDGGLIELVGVDGSTIHVAYSSGVAPECEDGVCVLPEVELEAMMTEVLAAERPGLSIKVQRLHP